MQTYNWQQKDWPDFKYSLDNSKDNLNFFAQKSGRVSGIIEALPEKIRNETIVSTLLSEAIKTSEIEGEYPNRHDVLTSIRKNLGLNITQGRINDRSAIGLGQLMTDIRSTFDEPLTTEKLFAWHKMLLGTHKKIVVGEWRSHTDTMQIISGTIGREKIHFEAPPSGQVSLEMKRFINWFNNTAPGGSHEIKNAPARSAIAHLYFESIHPFEDGNGRIGRAIVEKALAQNMGHPVTFSLSLTIEKNKKDYYSALETAQRSNEITSWINYFVQVLLDAQTEAEVGINFTLKKAKFFDTHKQGINERQTAVVARMFEEGPEGFQGGMNAKKYMSITGISKATATRDLQTLLEIGVFKSVGTGGRSTRYEINI